MTKRKTKRKTNRKPAKSIKHKTKPKAKTKAKAGSYDSLLGEKYITFNGHRYCITDVESITEGHNFTDYDGSKGYIPTFKKIFIKAVRQIDKKEYL